FRTCLEALERSLLDGPEAEVVVVLNAASDDVCAVMEDVEGAIRLDQRVDLGTAANWNRGVEATSAPRFAIVHEDARPDGGWLGTLCAAMDANAEVAIAGATLFNGDGTLQNRGWCTWDNGRSWPVREDTFGEVPADPVLPVDLVSSATALIDRRLWDVIGGFDETFFPAVGADVDLGWAAWA